MKVVLCFSIKEFLVVESKGSAAVKVRPTASLLLKDAKLAKGDRDERRDY